MSNDINKDRKYYDVGKKSWSQLCMSIMQLFVKDKVRRLNFHWLIYSY